MDVWTRRGIFIPSLIALEWSLTVEYLSRNKLTGSRWAKRFPPNSTYCLDSTSTEGKMWLFVLRGNRTRRPWGNSCKKRENITRVSWLQPLLNPLRLYYSRTLRTAHENHSRISFFFLLFCHFFMDWFIYCVCVTHATLYSRWNPLKPLFFKKHTCFWLSMCALEKPFILT